MVMNAETAKELELLARLFHNKFSKIVQEYLTESCKKKFEKEKLMYYLQQLDIQQLTEKTPSFQLDFNTDSDTEVITLSYTELPEEDFNVESKLEKLKQEFVEKIEVILDKQIFTPNADVFKIIQEKIDVSDYGRELSFGEIKKEFIFGLLNAQMRGPRYWYFYSLPNKLESDSEVLEFLKPVDKFLQEIKLIDRSLNIKFLDPYPYYPQYFICVVFFAELYKALLNSGLLKESNIQAEQIYSVFSLLKEQFTKSLNFLQGAEKENPILEQSINYQVFLKYLDSACELIELTKELLLNGKIIDLGPKNLYGLDLGKVLKPTLAEPKEVNVSKQQQGDLVYNKVFLKLLLGNISLYIKLYFDRKKYLSVESESDQKYDLIQCIYHFIFERLEIIYAGIFRQESGANPSSTDFSYYYSESILSLYERATSTLPVIYNTLLEPNFKNSLVLYEKLYDLYLNFKIVYQESYTYRLSVITNQPNKNIFYSFVLILGRFDAYFIQNILLKIFPELIKFNLFYSKTNYDTQEKYQDTQKECKLIEDYYKIVHHFLSKMSNCIDNANLFNILLESGFLTIKTPQDQSFTKIYQEEFNEIVKIYRENIKKDDEQEGKNKLRVKVNDFIKRIIILLGHELISQEDFDQHFYHLIKEIRLENPDFQLTIKQTSEDILACLDQAKNLSDIKQKFEIYYKGFKNCGDFIKDFQGCTNYGVQAAIKVSFEISYVALKDIYQPLLDSLLDIINSRCDFAEKVGYSLQEEPKKSYKLIEILSDFCQQLLELPANVLTKNQSSQSTEELQADLPENALAKNQSSRSIEELRADLEVLSKLKKFLDRCKNGFKLIQVLVDLLEKSEEKIKQLEKKSLDLLAKDCLVRDAQELDQKLSTLVLKELDLEELKSYRDQIKKLRNGLKPYASDKDCCSVESKLEAHKKLIQDQLNLLKPTYTPSQANEEWKQQVKAFNESIDELIHGFNKAQDWQDPNLASLIKARQEDRDILSKKIKKISDLDPSAISTFNKNSEILNFLKEAILQWNQAQASLLERAEVLKVLISGNSQTLTGDNFSAIKQLFYGYEELKKLSTLGSAPDQSSIGSAWTAGLEVLQAQYQNLFGQINETFTSFLPAVNLSIKLRLRIKPLIDWIEDFDPLHTSKPLQVLRLTLTQLDQRIEQTHLRIEQTHLEQEVKRCMDQMIEQIEKQGERVRSRVQGQTKITPEIDPLFSEELARFLHLPEETNILKLKPEFQASLELLAWLEERLGHKLCPLAQGTSEASAPQIKSGVSLKVSLSEIHHSPFETDRQISVIENYLLLGMIRILQKHIEDSPSLSSLDPKDPKTKEALENIRKVLANAARVWVNKLAKDIETLNTSFQNIAACKIPQDCLIHFKTSEDLKGIKDNIRDSFEVYALLKRLKEHLDSSKASKDWIQVIPFQRLEGLEKQVLGIWHDAPFLNSIVWIKNWLDAEEPHQAEQLKFVQEQFGLWLSALDQLFPESVAADQIWGFSKVRKILGRLKEAILLGTDPKSKLRCLLELTTEIYEAPIATAWHKALSCLIHDVTARPQPLFDRVQEKILGLKKITRKSFKELLEDPEGKKQLNEVYKACLEKFDQDCQEYRQASQPNFLSSRIACLSSFSVMKGVKIPEGNTEDSSRLRPGMQRSNSEGKMIQSSALKREPDKNNSQFNPELWEERKMDLPEAPPEQRLAKQNPSGLRPRMEPSNSEKLIQSPALERGYPNDQTAHRGFTDKSRFVKSNYQKRRSAEYQVAYEPKNKGQHPSYQEGNPGTFERKQTGFRGKGQQSKYTFQVEYRRKDDTTKDDTTKEDQIAGRKYQI